MADTEETKPKLRSPVVLREQTVRSNGYSSARWGRVQMDEDRCKELYGKLPVPIKAGECESPKRLVGTNSNDPV